MHAKREGRSRNSVAAGGLNNAGQCRNLPEEHLLGLRSSQLVHCHHRNVSWRSTMNRIVEWPCLRSSRAQHWAWANPPRRSRLVRPQWNAYGSPVCPSNYEYQRMVHVGLWPRLSREWLSRALPRLPARRLRGDSVPAQWSAAGTAVCPRNSNMLPASAAVCPCTDADQRASFSAYQQASS